MKHVLALLIAALTCVVGPARAQDAQNVASGQAAAVAWLALTDAGGYETSWDQAASIFKASISKARWQGALQSVRTPLGAVKARKLASARFTTSLPGAPEGSYVVVQYDTDFENKPGAVETVTALREPDGAWKVAGYFIK